MSGDEDGLAGTATLPLNMPGVDLDLHAVVELIAGVTVAPDYRRTGGKLELIRMMRQRLLQVGLLGLASWRFGLAADVVAGARDEAFALVYRHWRATLLPDMAAPVSYSDRLWAWKQSLDEEQMRRYVTGKLRPFAETGRKAQPGKPGKPGKAQGVKAQGGKAINVGLEEADRHSPTAPGSVGLR